MPRTRIRLIPVLAGLLCTSAWACSVSRIPTGEELVSHADVIVRAVAENYETPPANPKIWTTGVPDSVVHFKIMETIRGQTPSALTMHGYLVQRDDFNERPVPYDFVRPGGRAGSCFANSYREHGEYLLFLKQQNSGEYTVNWAALAPVNEQLHDANDAWLLWVREQAKKLKQ